MPAPTARRAMGPQRRALLCAFVALLLVYAGYAVWRASAWRGGRRPVKNTRGEQAQAPSVPPVQVPDDRRSGLPAHGESLAPVPTLPHTTKAPTDAPRPLALEPAVKKADNFVAVCAATRSRSAWTTLAASDPVRILLPSLARTTTAADNVRVFLGANADDAFWGRERAQELARHARTAWALDVALRQYAHAPNHIPFNALMRDAFDAGAEFLVRVNDDTEFVTPGWVRLGVDALAAFEPPNVGVVGPVCREGKTDILTHDMVHRTHLTIFDTYYPPEFSNWFVDDWISRVYGAARTRRHEGWVVKHRLTPTRYRPEERERAQLERLVGAGVQRVAHRLRQKRKFGPKFAIFTASDTSHLKNYERNLNTMRKYAKRHSDYEAAIFSEKDVHLQHGCRKNRMKFMRHCMLSNFLKQRPDIQAVLVLDSDNAIMNLNKRFEEYAITDLNFEIRFHNGEIAGGGFIVRNTEYTITFTKDWSNAENRLFPGDNGAMHQVILTRLGVGDRCLKHSGSYNQFRKCFVQVVQERNCDYDFFHQHASVLFPLHTYSYDGWLTQYRYSDRTFIHHGMKNPPIGGSNHGRLMPDVWAQNSSMHTERDAYYVSVHKEQELLEAALKRKTATLWPEGGMTLSSCLNKNDRLQIQDRHAETQPALRIIVLTMNRAKSLLRLLNSLAKAEYLNDLIYMDIWIDISAANTGADIDVMKVCTHFKWNFGRKSVHVHSKPAGLRGQWLHTWNMSVLGGLTKNTQERAIILEDDLEVSPFFWRWLKEGHRQYEHRQDIAGFSLNRLRLCPRTCKTQNLNGGNVPDNTNFLHAIVGPWGFSPLLHHWMNFTKWAQEYQKYEPQLKPYVPGILMTEWYKKFERDGRCPGTNCMWTQLHHYYTSWASDKWVVWAKCERNTALVISHQEKGLHYASHMGPDNVLLAHNLNPNLTQFPLHPIVIDYDGNLQ